MIKRALAAALCLILVFALLPKTALAASNTLYFFDGRLYTDDTHITHYTGGGWSGNGSTLTLTNFTFTTSAATALQLPGGTTLVLNGTNTVTSSYKKTSSNLTSNAIRVPGGDLTIQGSGELLATGGTSGNVSYGIDVGGSLTISGGSITGIGTSADANSYGVSAVGNITADGGSITGIGGTAANGTSYGVKTNGAISVDNRGNVTGIGGTSATGYSYGVSANGAITVENGGFLEGIGGVANEQSLHSIGVYSGTTIVADNGTITGKGVKATADSVGIQAQRVITASNGGKITGTGDDTTEVSQSTTSMGINGSSDIKAESGGTITGTSGSAAKSYGVSSGAYIISDGGTITGKGGSSGIIAQQSIQLSSGRLAGESTAPFYSVMNPVSLPSAYYWRTSKSAAYTQFPPQGYVWNSAHTYVDIRTSLPSAGGVGTGGDVGPDVPKTGDAATPALWLMIALLAGAGLALRRKRAL